MQCDMGKPTISCVFLTNCASNPGAGHSLFPNIVQKAPDGKWGLGIRYNLLLQNFLPKYFGIPNCFILSLGTDIHRDPDFIFFNVKSIGTITLVVTTLRSLAIFNVV
jgi:hypothetical protein